MTGTKHSVLATVYICVAIVAAIVLALVWPSVAVRCHLGGEVFLNLLKMMVVPLAKDLR